MTDTRMTEPAQRPPRPEGPSSSDLSRAEPVAVGPPALEFHDVSKTFKDGTRALDRTSLTVAPGEFVTVVGPSGCGKSTLLRVVSGLERARAQGARSAQSAVEAA